MNQITQNKYFQNADNWMWDYCQYLGSMKCKHGPIDLGVWVGNLSKSVSFAIVTDNESGEYHSGNIYTRRSLGLHVFNWLRNSSMGYLETFKLAQDAGIFKGMYHHIDLNILDQYHSDVYQYFMTVFTDKEAIVVSKTGVETKVIFSRDNSVDSLMSVYILNAETLEYIDTKDVYYIIGK